METVKIEEMENRRTGKLEEYLVFNYGKSGFRIGGENAKICFDKDPGLGKEELYQKYSSQKYNEDMTTHMRIFIKGFPYEEKIVSLNDIVNGIPELKEKAFTLDEFAEKIAEL